TVRAVVDRVLLEVDPRDRRAAALTRAAELVVHAIGLLVVCARQAQLEAAVHLAPDRIRQAFEVVARDLARQCIRRKLGDREDLVGPRAADAGDQARVAEQRVRAARIGREDARNAPGAQGVRLWAEMRELGLRSLGAKEPNPGAFL